MDGNSVRIYSNSVEVSQNLFEFKLRFILESLVGDTVTQEQLADVRMSPQVAKALRDVMVQAVDAYESANGLIPMGIDKEN